MKENTENINLLTVDLDEQVTAYIQRMRAEGAQAAMPYTSRIIGALDVVIAQKGLTGKWDLSPDGRSIYRVDGGGD